MRETLGDTDEEIELKGKQNNFLVKEVVTSNKRIVKEMEKVN